MFTLGFPDDFDSKWKYYKSYAKFKSKSFSTREIMFDLYNIATL